MTLYIVIITVFMLIGWVLTLVENGERNFPYGITGAFVGVIMPIICFIYITEITPTAIDVYRGKTALEITYKDSIPVDSIVVFKDKEK